MATNIDLLTHSSRTWLRKRNEKQHDLAITWDDTNRKEYLTGFHKRNVERRKDRAEHAKLMIRKERNENRANKRQRLAELANSFSTHQYSVSGEGGKHPNQSEIEFRSDELVTAVTVSEIALSTPVICIRPNSVEAESLSTDDEDEEKESVAKPAKKRVQTFKYESKKERKQKRADQMKMSNKKTSGYVSSRKPTPGSYSASSKKSIKNKK